MKLLRVETVPLWDDHGTLRPPDEGEVREDLPVVGWVNVLVIAGLERRTRRLLAVIN